MGLLNQKLDIVRELFDMLSQALENSHANRLEWIIMVLVGCGILSGVLFACGHNVLECLPEFFEHRRRWRGAVIETIRVRTKAEKLKLIVLSSHQVELEIVSASFFSSTPVHKRAVDCAVDESQCSSSVGPQLLPGLKQQRSEVVCDRDLTGGCPCGSPFSA